MIAQHIGKEPCRSRGVATPRDEYVHDLTFLVYGSVNVVPPTSDLRVGLSNEPTRPDRMPAWSCRVDQQRCEALNPPVQGDVIDLDALKNANLVSREVRSVKVFASGTIDKAVSLKGIRVTKGARAAIEAAGGKIED